MIESYEKLIKMKSIVSSRIEENQKLLEKIEKGLYIEKDFFVEKLILYLNMEMNREYYSYKIKDKYNNIANVLIKRNSNIFKEYIENNEKINFNIEELIDIRKFNNENEIIILSLKDEKNINISYICETLEFETLSYSEKLKDKISQFIDYIINKNINNIIHL